LLLKLSFTITETEVVKKYNNFDVRKYYIVYLTLEIIIISFYLFKDLPALLFYNKLTITPAKTISHTVIKRCNYMHFITLTFRLNLQTLMTRLLKTHA